MELGIGLRGDVTYDKHCTVDGCGRCDKRTEGKMEEINIELTKLRKGEDCKTKLTHKETHRLGKEIVRAEARKGYDCKIDFKDGSFRLRETKRI